MVHLILPEDQDLACEEEIRIIKCGFDVISQYFFCHYIRGIYSEYLRLFNNFKEFYDFLDGDIYENSCYYGCVFPEDIIKTYRINMKRINTTGFEKESISEWYQNETAEEKSTYKQGEKTKKQTLNWIKKFKNCETEQEFSKVLRGFSRSSFAYDNKGIILSLLIYNDKEKLLKIGRNFLSLFLDSKHDTVFLSLVYGVDEVFKLFDDFLNLSKQELNKKKRDLQANVKAVMKAENIQIEKHFNTFNNLYMIATIYYYNFKSRLEQYITLQVYSSFEDFASDLNGDLSDCDIEGDLNLNIDIHQYKTNEETRLPKKYLDIQHCKISKTFRDNKFHVEQLLEYNGKQRVLRSKDFDFFFDFKQFLKNDLSGADLLMCDGLLNIQSLSECNLTNIILRSDVYQHFGIPVAGIKMELKEINDSDESDEENKKLAELHQDSDFTDDIYSQIFYVSDIHLENRFAMNHCRTNYDRYYVLRKIVDNIKNDIFQEKNHIDFMHFYRRVLLICGDTASDINLFSEFVNTLKILVPLGIKIIFVLGNHEIWGANNFNQYKETIATYKRILTENGMFLLESNILYFDYYSNDIEEITENELIEIDENGVSDKLSNARHIFFGGMGMAPYNKSFNAQNLIYRNAIDRPHELEYGINFENLYYKVLTMLPKESVIIATHFPPSDWCDNFKPKHGYLYINGHTHKNFYYNDGSVKIYADNQVGYRKRNVHVKPILISASLDIFKFYKDGIHEISPLSYVNFYRGKNKRIDYNIENTIIYMLKKQDYYLFLSKSIKSRHLCLLNGGARKKLELNDLNYYYENMMKMIAKIEAPLYKYLSFQDKIADQVKKIGGSGYSHGCIVDIDFYNHILVHPITHKIFAYWASDTYNKKFYSSIESLLELNCPHCFSEYKKLLSANEIMPFLQDKNTQEYKVIHDTSMYQISNEIYKMQKLKMHVLTTWIEPVEQIESTDVAELPTENSAID